MNTMGDLSCNAYRCAEGNHTLQDNLFVALCRMWLSWAVPIMTESRMARSETCCAFPVHIVLANVASC
jgi:hypothetical protein